MQELTIINQSLPVINVNFEEVKKDLQEQLEQYKILVVTEESLSLCKTNQKALAGLKNKVDTYRKDIKKTMSVPITEFESKCKELVSLIESAEQPLKDGIKVFDDMKREEKRKTASELISESIQSNGLNEKYASKLTVLDEYLNLSSSKKSVKEDIEKRAFMLIEEQKKELELLELIQDAIQTVNKRINRQLKLSEFQRYIDNGMTAKEVIQIINANADRIYEAENPKPVEKPGIPVEQPKPIEHPRPAEQPKPIERPNPVENTPIKSDPLWVVGMEITATTSQFMALKQFLLENNIAYSTNKKELIG